MSDTGHLKCPRCGKELSAAAPEGLCPSCLGALNFATDTAFTGADAKETLPPMAPAELAPHFPQLEILECLGRGGMGVVYKARQKSLNRLVALKLLAPERVQDVKFAERFAREAHALAALNHPSIVTVHDFGQAGGYYFLLMEFVDGVNLRQLLRSRKLQPAEALAIVPPICEALQYAHEHGIVHRDIKPENLLLAKDGRVKIADFGIAKMMGSAASAASFSLSSGGEGQREEAPGSSATQQTTMGTPQYMAPEQREQPQAADHRADIYSLGVVLYELLTGELPADKLQPPSRVRGVQIDVRLDEIVLRALEKTPELRYQTAGEFKTQVETVVASVQLEDGSPIRQVENSPLMLLKQARGRFTRPEYLATLVGGLMKNQGVGELSLYADHLVFSFGVQRTEIPFESLRQLGTSRGSWWTSPIGLQYLSLIYDDQGQTRHLMFMGGEGFFRTEDDTENVAEEWLAGIQAAVQRAGRKPIPVATERPMVVPSPPWAAAWILLPVLPLVLSVWLLRVGRTMNPRHAIDPLWGPELLPLLPLLTPLFWWAAIGIFSGGLRRPSGHANRLAEGNKHVSWHVATVTFYAGVILGILFIGMLSFRFSRDSAYLLVVGIMAVVSPFVGVITGNALRQAEQGNDEGRLKQIKGRLKALSVVAWILALPVVGFAIFFFDAMLSERGGWNPATSEAVLVPLTWLGAVLLPWAGSSLWRAASQAGIDSQPRKAAGKGMFLWVTGALLVMFLLAGFAWLSANARRVAEAQSAARAAAERDSRRGNEKGMVRTNHAGASQTTSNLVSTPDQSVTSTHTVVVPTRFGFPVVAGIFILGLGVGLVVLLVWVSRKHGVKGCLVGGLVAGALLLMVGLLVMLAYWGSSVREIRKAFQPIATMELSAINQNSPPAVPNGLAMQVQNGFNLKVPPGQLVTFEVFIRHGDDRREPVPALTAVVATDEGDGINTWLSWMGKREDDGQGTNQLWSWSVNGNVLGAVPMPNRTDYGTNMAWHVKHREVLNWWQLAMPKNKVISAGSIQEIALFRTFGSATADPAQPKEIIVRIKRHGIPEEMKMQVGQYQMLLGLEAYEKVAAWNQKAGIGVKRTLETGARSLKGTATLVAEYEQDLRWRWRVTKQQPARILFSLIDTDATGKYTSFIPSSLQESRPGNGDWSRAKDIVLTWARGGTTSVLKLEDQFIAPEPAQPNLVSSAVSMQVGQSIRNLTSPVALSSDYYQTLWEAEVTRYSADGAVKSPRLLRLVARLADPNQAKEISAFAEDDPVKEIKGIHPGTVVRGEAQKAQAKNPMPTPLVPEELVEMARKDFERAKLLLEAGRATAGEWIDAETHFKWAEAMNKGDEIGALKAKRDGAAKKYEGLKQVVEAKRTPNAELPKLARELAEAETAFRQAGISKNPPTGASIKVLDLTLGKSAGPMMMMESATPLEPGEKVVVLTRDSGGKVQDGVVNHLIMNGAEGKSSLILIWMLPFNFFDEGKAVRAELGRYQTGHRLTLTNGLPQTLFSVTNAEGAILYGEIRYDRNVPTEDAAKAEVKVKVSADSVRYEGGKLNAEMSVAMPQGCQLHATSWTSGKEPGVAMAFLTDKGTDSEISGGVSWSWRMTLDEKTGAMAVQQIKDKVGKDSIILKLGQAKELFSVTNSVGEVFSGSLELVGNKP